MHKIIFTLLISGVALGGCGVVRDSALNPANWFGRSQQAPVETTTEAANPLIPRGNTLFRRASADKVDYQGVLFEEVIELKVERVPGGAIVRATGRAARQGRYEVRLTPVVEDETPVNGVLTYRFEGVIPAVLTDIGTPPTREVTAARRVTDQTLRGVNTIRVEAERNARVARR